MFSVAYGYLMNEEEKMLPMELGPEYVKYTKRTKRLIPCLIYGSFKKSLKPQIAARYSKLNAL